MTYRAATVTPQRADFSAFPDSPYAAELRKENQGGRFAPEIEAEFARARLLNGRALIRMACALAALVAILRGLEQALGGFSILRAPTGPAVTGLVISISVALAWIAWTPAFERLYAPTARIFVPLRNIIAAFPIAAAAAHGQLELLMILPAMVLGPFFFLGLPSRVAAVCVGLTIASFAVAAVLFGLALPVTLRACVFVLLVAMACAMAAEEIEKRARAGFLDGRLIAELAQHDALTGLKNRRIFDEHLTRLWQQASDEGRGLAVMLIDVDHFKAYNDRYGHQAGDQALRRVAQTLQALIDRPLDMLARYGGEEFAVLMYDQDANAASAVAERMRKAVADLAIEHRGSRASASVTISVGVAAIEPTHERKPRGALQLADEALYEAKVRGRNRVELMAEAEYRGLVTGVFSKSAFRGAMARR